MKTLKLLCAGLCVTLFGSLSTFAQNYDLSWFTIDGGGGTSTGGVYSLSGTIGQPDAGTMSGGNYSLTGGFWSVAVAIQTVGAPLLTITRSGSNVVISWPYPATNFGLQVNSSLGTTNWSAITQTPTNNGSIWSVTIPASAGARFYRLKAP
jgi:hypothetical protein